MFRFMKSSKYLQVLALSVLMSLGVIVSGCLLLAPEDDNDAVDEPEDPEVILIDFDDGVIQGFSKFGDWARSSVEASTDNATAGETGYSAKISFTEPLPQADSTRWYTTNVSIPAPEGDDVRWLFYYIKIESIGQSGDSTPTLAFRAYGADGSPEINRTGHVDLSDIDGQVDLDLEDFNGTQIETKEDGWYKVSFKWTNEYNSTSNWDWPLDAVMFLFFHVPEGSTILIDNIGYE